jgi:hypothetical protein
MHASCSPLSCVGRWMRPCAGASSRKHEAITLGEEHNRLRQQAAGDETQRLRRGPIQPLARRRPRREVAARRPPRRPASVPPDQPENDPAEGRQSGRRRSSTRRAEDPKRAQADRASARTTDARRRTLSPSPTPPPPPAQSAGPMPNRSRTAPARSCRSPPRHGPPARRCVHHAPPQAAGQTPRARCAARATSSTLWNETTAASHEPAPIVERPTTPHNRPDNPAARSCALVPSKAGQSCASRAGLASRQPRVRRRVGRRGPSRPVALRSIESSGGRRWRRSSAMAVRGRC